MSVTSGPGAPTERDATSAASRSDAVQTSQPPAPALADGVELLGEMEGSGYRTPPALARRADGQVVQLTRLLYLVLAAVDGRRDHQEIAEQVSRDFGRLVSAENIAALIDQQLHPLGLLRLADGSQPEVRKSNPLLALRFRYVVTNPVITRRITAPFAALFNPVIVAALVAAFVAVCWWVLWDKGLASAAHEALYQPGLLLIVFAVTVLSAGFHEFGHASAARYGGATPGVMGMGLYLVWPAFYTDVTDSYRLGRAGRVRTDLGGLYFNTIVAVGMFATWWVIRWDALLLIIATQVLQMVRQLAPLVRFDGYHVLADVTGVPDLYQHIKPTLLGLLPHRWGRPEHQILKPWARAVVSIWVLTVVPLLIAMLGIMIYAFPRIAATAWDSLSQQWSGFGKAFGEGDVLAMATGLLSMVALALPIFGMVYIVVRLVRRIATAVWTRTDGRPLQRALAGLTALAIVAALVWAWWPENDRYRPIQAYERGSLQDVTPLAARTGTGLQEGSVARGRTVWTGDLPTRDKPALSVVLVPRDGTSDTGGSDPNATSTDGTQTGETGTAGPDTWVFPFNRPAAPGEGDNQAMAVNTEDGSTVYDVAFALVWAEGDTTDNVNSAYALASCEACQTVAVAFQVVLVLGQSDTVVPQNIAAAVNYNCIECVTSALATQLVVTLDGPLSDTAMSDLTALWALIAEYGNNIEDIPLSEIRAQLTDFEQQILAIIERDQDGATSEGQQTEASPNASPAASPNSSSGPSGSAGPSSGADSGRGSGSQSGEASVEPSPTSSSQAPQPKPSAGSSSSPSAQTSPTAGTTSGSSAARSTTASPTASTSP